MLDVLSDGGVELLTTLAYAAGMVGLTAVGFLAERAGVDLLTHGGGAVGVWLVAVGIVAMYGGLKVFGGQFLAAVRGRDARDGDA